MTRRLGVLFAAFVVGVIQAQNDDPAPLYALPNANIVVYSSGTMAATGDGRTLVVANMLNNTVSFVDAIQNELLGEIAVGDDPRSVAITDNDAFALVVNRGSGTLSVVNIAQQTVVNEYLLGSLPYGIVPDGDTAAYIALQGTDEVIHIDVLTGEILDRIPVPESPAGLALWDDFLYVSHLWSGDLSLVYLPQMKVVRTISTGLDTGLSQAIEIDPANGLAYLPQTRLNSQNGVLTFDTTVFPVVNVVTLSDMTTQRPQQITLDTADRPVNMPFAVAVDRVRGWLYVVNAGSNDVTIIELSSGDLLEHVEVGSNPRGIWLNGDGSKAFIHNAIDGSLTVLDTRTRSVLTVVPISDLIIPIDVFLGAQLFHTSDDERMSRDGWLSCASCHFDGQSDGRVWQGIADGGRNTPVLFGLADAKVYTWTGDWQDLSELETKIRELHAGGGLQDGDAISLDMETLISYIVALDSPETPNHLDATQVEVGRAMFDSLDCATCHSGETLSDGLLHDVGTGGEFRTPTLNWLWQSAPYLHDGRADDLHELFSLPGDHLLIESIALEELSALVEYLLSLPAD